MKVWSERPIIGRFAVLVLLVQWLLTASACYAAGSADYEIPLTDLKKVEKKAPKKSENKTRREKRKSDKAEQKPSVTVPPATGEQAEPAVSSDLAAPRITHDPFSYVVPGKRTIVKAVIASQEELKSVRCQFRSVAGSGFAFVPMTKEEGSRFTYSAILPALAQNSQSLRYSMVVVDIADKVSRSREYIIPVNPLPITPGWQLEPNKTPILIGLETSGKPLEGFSDQLVEAPDKQ